MTVTESKWVELLAAARRVHQNAYAPYSRFRVGAAVLADDGKIYSGCNVENASYGLTICAERAAIFSAISAGAKRISALTIFTDTNEPTAPCGACRQVIQEFGPDIEIRAGCRGEKVLTRSLKALLPDSFGRSNLGG
jgi:cytidine deaminase